VKQPINHEYIVVEGPIGVGKTSLARRLAQTLGATEVMEGAEENPFLPRFYEDPRSAALPTQLFFLFQRARQLQEMRQSDIFRPRRVSDFLFEKDRLFASLNLDDDELALYEQVYDKLALDVPTPDLVIYLQAPVEVLMHRVARRGVSYEQDIDASYLAGLNDAYMRFFHRYEQAPLLIVNAAEIDLVQGHRSYELLLEQIAGIHSGRHYFNPVLTES